MEGTGEGCGFFCSLKLLYLSRMSWQFCCRLLIIHFVLLLNVCQASRALWQKCPYYINANKIPGELLRKNVTRNLSESSMSNGMLKTLSNSKSNVFFTVKNIEIFIKTPLLRENMISSHIQITCFLQTWKDRCCYGYIINSVFCCQKY